MKTTIDGIAKAAGVSTATVDRVPNSREGVRERTCVSLLQVARKLGYLDDAGDVQTAAAILKFAFVLPAGTNQFIQVLQSQN